MEPAFSAFVITALVDVIAGGPGWAGEGPPPIGYRRSGAEIDRFLASCGIESTRGSGSRLPCLEADLRRTASDADGMRLIRCAIETVADPRCYRDDQDKADAVRLHLNKHLVADGYEVVIFGGRALLRRRGTGSSVVEAVADKTVALDFDTVSREVERAIENAEDDPEDAVTAACATLEAVCRSILAELDLPMPAKKDIGSLVRAVQEPLELSPSRSDLPEEITEDVRQVLSGLTTTAKGIGALRTHGGDAHGRERGRRSIDPRIARLAIHAASTVAFFFIETWERKQRRALSRLDGSS